MERLTKPEQDFETQFCEECMENGCIFHGEPNGCNNPNNACVSFCYFTSCADKLREYEDAEEKGLLVRLPCKIGDTVYILVWSNYISRIPNKYEQEICEGFYIGDDGIVQVRVSDRKCNHGTYGVMGDTVFLTREEAERALKEARE